MIRAHELDAGDAAHLVSSWFASEAARPILVCLAGAPNIGQYQVSVFPPSVSALEAVSERRDMIDALRDERLSLNAFASRLNLDSVRTVRGVRWTATAVKRVIGLCST